MDTEARVRRLRESLPADTALLIENAPDRFYLTGFSSSAGQVLITRETALFLIDSRYAEAASAAVKSCEVRLSRRPNEEVREILSENACTALVLPADSTSVRRLNTLIAALPGVTVSADARWDTLLADMRAVKTAEEQSFIRQAQQLTDDTFAYVLDILRPGRTEREIALDMEFTMRRRGSEGVAFDFIVVSGKNSSLPHGVPTDKPIENGDFVTMDFGAVVNGYRSDMTRTVAVGHISEEQWQVYDTVLTAQQAALSAIRAGQVCADIDRVARDIIRDAGYGACFGHGLGHSVGIDIHESPAFSPRCDTVLRPGMVMTVEPGIYLPGKYGVRIEDMVFVTADGCENITRSQKQLITVR